MKIYIKQSIVAMKLNDAGFRAPKGGPVRQMHIYRIMMDTGLQLNQLHISEKPDKNEDRLHSGPKALIEIESSGTNLSRSKTLA